MSAFLIATNQTPDWLPAELGGQAALGLVDYGAAGGQVLVSSNLGSLDLYDKRKHERDNFTCLRNLARCARER